MTCRLCSPPVYDPDAAPPPSGWCSEACALEWREARQPWREWPWHSERGPLSDVSDLIETGSRIGLADAVSYEREWRYGSNAVAMLDLLALRDGVRPWQSTRALYATRVWDSTPPVRFDPRHRDRPPSAERIRMVERMPDLGALIARWSAR